jgi:hypothetical protein
MIRMPASREFAINPDDEPTVRRGTKTRVGDRRIPVVLIAKERTVRTVGHDVGNVSMISVAM